VIAVPNQTNFPGKTTPAVTQEQQQQSETERGTSNNPFLVRVLPAPPTEEQTAREQEQTTANGRTFWLTVTIATLTGGLLLVGYLQWKTYEASLTTNKEIERADVLFHTVKFFDAARNAYTDEIRPDTVLLFVQRNYGRTTATDVRVRWQFFVDTERVFDTGFLASAIIGPAGELETNVGTTMGALTGARFNDVGGGHASLQAFGEVVYRDVFGQQHRAKFRGSFRTINAATGHGGFAIEIEERT